MPSEAHEQLVQFLLDNPTPADATLADLRAGFDAFLTAQPLAEEAEAAEVTVGGVAAEWVRVPESQDDRVVFYLHGGGYSMGSAAGYRPFAARLAREARARVLTVDYRLAPESPYPAAMDDGVAAWRGLLDEGVAPERVVAAADSGSVGFVLALTARLRDEGLPLPAAVVGLCPWVNVAVGETIAETQDVGDPINAREALRYFAGLYLGEHAPDDPVVNVLHGTLRGFPPLLLLAGTRDIGYGDALKVAALARAAGVPVRFRAFHGLIHNFQLAAHLPEAGEAVAAMAAFLDERLQEPVSATQERER